MIAHISGTVLSVAGTQAVVEVGGVGLAVLATPSTVAELRVGERAALYTHLVVREESLTLYGFATAIERGTFDSLQSVTGVGPKLALALLAVHSPLSLSAAVAAGDRAALEKVPGVGSKVAARLLLELGGKLSLPHQDGTSHASDEREQVIEALVSLGWNMKAAGKAVDAVTDGPITAGEVADKLRAALKALGGHRG